MRFAVLLLTLLGPLAAIPAHAGVKNTVHNLSAFGPGTIKAEEGEETRICIFCHTPHEASQHTGVLWNRNDSTANYIPYQSATLNAAVDQPTGASKLCLSCHDGTVALGELISEPVEIGMVGGVRFMPAGTALLDTDLGDDHPVSFVYDEALTSLNPELADPTKLPDEVQLDALNQLQCSTCHDPHDEGFGKFLVAPRLDSALCIVCHDPTGWPSASHATSGATWNDTVPDPWPRSSFTTVSENACENCHRPHSGQSPEWILEYAAEEDNCLICHNGNVAASDIEADISAAFHHPVELTSGVHTPNEDATLPMTKHVECTDCHNPHAAWNAPTDPPLASGALRGATGLDDALLPVDSVIYEYEVCFKCHAEFSMTDPVINRQHVQNDKRLQFDGSNPSYHPVAHLGKNLDVPSLIPPLTENSQIFCSDCHASDNGPGAGGSGPAGPHGSIYPHILEREYNTIDEMEFDEGLYDLCFKCHSVTNILDDRSFDKHKKHIEKENSPCSACHDPHGISSTQGNSLNNSNLINFDLTIVSPDPKSGRLEFIDLGDFKGECYLECHGEKHDPEKY